MALTEREQKAIHSEQQKHYLELGKKTLPSTVQKGTRPPGHPCNEVLMSAFYGSPSGQEPIQAHSEIKTEGQKESDPTRMRGSLTEEGKSNCSEDQKDLEIIELLELFNTVCYNKNNLLIFFQ